MKFLRNILDKVGENFHEGGKLEKLYPLYDAIDTILYVPSETASNGPFVRDHVDVKRSMIFVVIALLPCLLFGIYNVGLQGAGALASEKSFFELFLSGAIAVVPMYAVVFTVGGLCEGIFAVIRKHEINEGFLVTGMLIPLTMPPTLPLWMLAIATLFGIIIGKEIFGGTGFNIFNPALTARAFVFFAYPTTMSGDKVWALEGMSGATPLLKVASSSGNDPYTLLGDYSWMEMFLGFIPGSIGETSTLCVLIGAIFLIITGIGSWRTMSGVMIGMMFMTLILNQFGQLIGSTNPMLYIPPHYHFVMGSFAFGMVFMATDPVSSAHTKKGMWYYGILVGVMCVIIRAINPAYPEGMMLAILFANAFAPLFDYYVLEANVKRRKLRYGK
ncbi:MAG: NADH:ubiquinone reductase (Na(+)-transporting) subunit B [bacterium TMED161]|nr:MAG: NADH:ubiquinone reductase (Na(+)-transporting) subunit B [bacterium TMED161]